MDNLEKLILRIAPGKFHYLKFILEGYDNLAILSSINSKEGLVVVRFPERQRKDVLTLLAAIADILTD